ncbi:MAG TPA: OmpA family protein [Hyphomonadaceae bacterium]|jgi:OOP family OmpA-OmpF porin|nr:OmpA family protein [Hyphomonadaceae bacterium]
MLAIYTAFLGPHSAGKLQAELQVKAQAALAEARLPTWRATANGASIELEGAAPTEEAKERAIRIIRGFTGVASIQADHVVVAPFADPFEWTARKESGRVFLDGHAPSRTALSAIHEEARKLYGSDLQDEASLASGAPEGVEWEVAAIKGLEGLARLDRGTAILRGNELRVEGLARSDEDAQSILTWLHGEKGGAKIITDIAGPAEWYARVEGGRIYIRGRASSEDAQAQLIRAAGGARVAEDKSYVGPTGAWQARARAALPLLTEFESGEIAVQGKTFRISGEAPASIIGYLHDDMDRISDGYSVEYNVTEAEPDMPELRGIDPRLGAKAEMDACQAALNRIADAYKITFSNGRAAMDRSSGKALDRVLAVLKACPGGNVEIQGHTDATGPRSKNIALSRNRADTVRDYLIQRGVSANRLSAVGFGPDRPVASNRTDSGKVRNRRIEFRMVRGVSN